MKAIRKNIFVWAFCLSAISLAFNASAQQAVVNEPQSQPVQLPQVFWDPTFYLWFATGLILAAVLLTLYRAVNVMSGLLETKSKDMSQVSVRTAEYQERPSRWTDFIRSMTRSVPVEKEKDVMLDHDYDGIRELDNQLPPWWKYGFYLTIVFAFVYLFGYHLSGTGKLQEAEYNEQMAEAAAQKEEMMKKNADFVTAENVKPLSDPALLAEGKMIFEKNCATCHKVDGGGNVGPNLTDDFWIHGGGINNMFRVITDGVLAKGMISWKSQLSPKQIQEVASYVITLHGTNPPGSKDPQGDLWKAAIEPVDSATTQPDSVKAVRI
jgi:cytochrome c oxidase cbb3-type subunit 3